MVSFIQDFGILFITIVVVSFLIKIIKQPIIIGYVLSGFLFSFFIGNSNEGEINILANLGITFLLFLMGLEFDFKKFKYLGKDIIIATFLQSAILFFIAFGFNRFFGFNNTENIYLAVLFMFSSTLLVAKWIEDKRETNTLYGRVTLGIIIVQDLIAIVILTILNNLHKTTTNNLLLVPFGGFVLIIIAYIFAKYFLNWLLKFAVRYPELMFIFSLGVCFFFVEISYLLEYSTTIGAFIAGITLANTNYKNDIYGRLKPLIIFFNMLFFVGLGFQIKLDVISDNALFLLMFCLLALILKPIIIYTTLKLRGYDIKTSLLSGLNLAQFSEFGIIIISGGLISGVISKEIGTLAIIAIIITMIVSSYLIKYDKFIFKMFENRLGHFEKFFPVKIKENIDLDLKEYNIIFFGYYDLSKEIAAKFEGLGKKMLVIEKDPTNIRILKEEKIPYIYNSITNPYFFDSLDFKKAEIVVSNLNDAEDTKMIISKCKKDNSKCVLIVTAKSIRDSLSLYELGADYVIYPSYINEQQVSILLEDYNTDINKVITKKINDINKLRAIESKRNSYNKNFDLNHFIDKLSKKKI